MVQSKKPVKCKNCGYRWNTKSKMMYVCCPKCMRKLRLVPKKKKKK